MFISCLDSLIMQGSAKRSSNMFSCSASTFGMSAERLVLIFRVFVWDSMFLSQVEQHPVAQVAPGNGSSVVWNAAGQIRATAAADSCTRQEHGCSGIAVHNIAHEGCWLLLLKEGKKAGSWYSQLRVIWSNQRGQRWISHTYCESDKVILNYTFNSVKHQKLCVLFYSVKCDQIWVFPSCWEIWCSFFWMDTTKWMCDWRISVPKIKGLCENLCIFCSKGVHF